MHVAHRNNLNKNQSVGKFCARINLLTAIRVWLQKIMFITLSPRQNAKL